MNLKEQKKIPGVFSQISHKTASSYSLQSGLKNIINADIGTLGGISLGVSLILGAIILSGSAEMFFHVPSLMITLGGTIAALLVTYPVEKIQSVIQVTKKTLVTGNLDLTPWYYLMINLATIARRDGVLALEETLSEVEDEFLKYGLQMMIDGSTPDSVKEILEKEIEEMKKRHLTGRSVWKSMGMYAPAFGMIGTLIGLVQMLQNLNSPENIGSGMATALLTTFYGALYANLFCLPIQGKLEQRTQEEVQLKDMFLHGILAIYAGDNPKMVAEKLKVFLKPNLRRELS